MRTPQTLSRILKAAAVLSGHTTDELALEAGISPSRLGRILGGWTTPKDDEPARILTTCGFDSALLTDRIGTGEVRGEGDGSGWSGSMIDLCPLGLLFTAQSPFELQAVPWKDCDLSIDWLSLTFNLNDRSGFLRLARTVGTPAGADHLYGRSFIQGKGEGRLLVQIDPLKRPMRDARIEYNPNTCSQSTKAFVAELLDAALVYPLSVHVTRIDVAADLPVSIHDVQGLGVRKRKLNLWIGSKGVETIMFGRDKSAKRMRTYDKKQERIDRGRGDETMKSWTRFEAELKLSRTKGDSLLLGDLHTLENPYQDLRLFILRPDGLSFERRIMVDYARLLGLPALMRELEPKRFDELVRDLEQSDNAPIVPHPRDLFSARWRGVAKRFLRALKIKGTP